jgi:predicted NAD-dependent protein-ADP-ribosyltransferase YbiA (DUF1768 family)
MRFVTLLVAWIALLAMTFVDAKPRHAQTNPIWAALKQASALEETCTIVFGDCIKTVTKQNDKGVDVVTYDKGVVIDSETVYFFGQPGIDAISPKAPCNVFSNTYVNDKLKIKPFEFRVAHTDKHPTVASTYEYNSVEKCFQMSKIEFCRLIQLRDQPSPSETSDTVSSVSTEPPIDDPLGLNIPAGSVAESVVEINRLISPKDQAAIGIVKSTPTLTEKYFPYMKNFNSDCGEKWKEIRVTVMQQCVKQRVVQLPECICDHKDKKFYETSSDGYWGIGKTYAESFAVPMTLTPDEKNEIDKKDLNHAKVSNVAGKIIQHAVKENCP